MLTWSGGFVMFKGPLMYVIGCIGYCCASLISNFWCPAFVYQEEEPVSVKKLRKF